MNGLQLLVALAVGCLVVLGVMLLVDKRNPRQQLDDRPEPRPTDVPGPYLGDGDLDRHTNERIAAESRLYRRNI